MPKRLRAWLVPTFDPCQEKGRQCGRIYRNGPSLELTEGVAAPVRDGVSADERCRLDAMFFAILSLIIHATSGLLHRFT